MNDHDIPFFLGERLVGSYSIPLHGGKANLAVAVRERWAEVFVRVIRCGASFKRSLKRRVGVEQSSREDLNSLVKGSLGIQGLAGLSSQIESKTSQQIRLEWSEESTEEYTFTAPKCGRLTVALYQFQRVLDLHFRDTHWFHDAQWSKTVECWMDRVHDDSSRILGDSACGCQPRPVEKMTRPILLTVNNLTLVTGTEERNAETLLPEVGLTLSQYPTEKVSVRLLRHMLPEHSCFLAGLDEPQLDATVEAYIATLGEQVASTQAEQAQEIDGRVYTVKIPPDKIRDVIGPGGKVIRGIIEQTGVKIDVEDDGTVHVASNDSDAASKALQMIGDLTANAEVGKTYLGKVVRIVDFGAFVEIFPGTDGLLHISEIAENRVKEVRDELKEGDQILVKVIGLENNKIKLSRKAILKEQREKQTRLPTALRSE